MTEVRERTINHPSTWTSRAIGGKAGLAYRLDPKHLSAFDTLLMQTRDVGVEQITREAFSHPDIQDLIDDVLNIVVNGRGAVIVQGVSRDRYSVDDCARILWGLGTHWGAPAVQNTQGDLLGHVRQEKHNPTNRTYITNRELALHSDEHEIICLMCMQAAESGGVSRIASGLAVYDEILKRRPDLLPPLFKGYPYAVTGAKFSKQPVTPYSIPVFSWNEGRLSCYFMRPYMEAAAEKQGERMPSDLVEALDLFEEIANRADVCLDFTLEPGELLICNNFITMHARTSFTDSEQNKRHLLRLWLNLENGRPVLPELRDLGRAHERTHRESLEPFGG